MLRSPTEVSVSGEDGIYILQKKHDAVHSVVQRDLYCRHAGQRTKCLLTKRVSSAYIFEKIGGFFANRTGGISYNAERHQIFFWKEVVSFHFYRSGMVISSLTSRASRGL